MEKETGSGRRGAGEDSIYKDGNRWRGAVSLGTTGDGRRRRIKVSGRTKAEVIAKLKELHRSLDARIEQPTRRLTVGSFLDAWLAGLPARVEPSTVTNYTDMVKTHLKPALGAKILSQLTVSDVNAVWAAKRKAGYKPNSIRIMRAVLRAALRQAERESLVIRNVAALSDPPRVGQAEGRSLTIPEAKRLLDAAAGDRLEALYALTLTLGLRRGEALGLAWADIDLDERSMVLRRQIARIRLDEDAAATATGRRTDLVLKELKTKRSRRTLHLTPTLVAMLRSHRARQAAEQLAVGPAWVDSGLVFTTAIGTPLHPDNFAHYFDRLCRKAGLGHWHPHELRHSAASIMLAQGTPLWVVSEVLGHASVAITKDVYGHLLGGEKQAAAEAITDVLFSSGEEAESEDGSAAEER